MWECPVKDCGYRVVTTTTQWAGTAKMEHARKVHPELDPQIFCYRKQTERVAPRSEEDIRKEAGLPDGVPTPECLMGSRCGLCNKWWSVMPRFQLQVSREAHFRDEHNMSPAEARQAYKEQDPKRLQKAASRRATKERKAAGLPLLGRWGARKEAEEEEGAAAEGLPDAAAAS